MNAQENKPNISNIYEDIDCLLLTKQLRKRAGPVTSIKYG